MLEQRKGKKTKLVHHDVPGYQPEVKNSPVDDQRSINEMKKPEVAAETVKELMRSTFPVRRQDVLKGLSIAKLKKLYPHLFTPEEVRPLNKSVICLVYRVFL